MWYAVNRHFYLKTSSDTPVVKFVHNIFIFSIYHMIFHIYPEQNPLTNKYIAFGYIWLRLKMAQELFLRMLFNLSLK